MLTDVVIAAVSVAVAIAVIVVVVVGGGGGGGCCCVLFMDIAIVILTALVVLMYAFQGTYSDCHVQVTHKDKGKLSVIHDHDKTQYNIDKHKTHATTLTMNKQTY